MVKIVCSLDCRNSPRKQFLKDFNIAFAQGNSIFMAEHVAEDIHWITLGDKETKGKKAFLDSIKQMAETKVAKLEILKIITHGKDASANGIMTLEDDTQFQFCDVYAFEGAKENVLKSITSYVIAS